MAVFGAPVAHEDDPERAVRAALSIRDALAGSHVDSRIAVHTGEALVALDARADEGEALVVGDVVNSAARLQTAAAVNGVLVGEATFRATQQVIEYRPVAAVAGKGKSELLPAWEAVAPRARFGVDVDEGAHCELVGREAELDTLRAALARARTQSSVQLVTLTGVPGIGKSRLIAELLVLADTDSEIIWWRQGRCLPYGAGISFWALGEMAKAQAGVLETDSAEQAEQKLRDAVIALVVDASEGEWILSHLRPLLGLPGATAEQSERFAAWLRFFEALAEVRPAVLVFEDLHWADDGLLDFVDHLADWAGAVPLLIVCTARPELLDRRPGWGGGKRNATAISLTPLSDEDVGRLIAALLERSVLPAETKTELLRRADGNPLYAEEYVRALREGRRPEESLPENVQGIIAARLDTLAPEDKGLLQDAAVVGKVFWLGAITAIGSLSRATAEERLHALERREFIRRARRGSVSDDAEYAFRHVLVRDVAYNQIPRSARAEKHQSAATWIGTLGDDRSEDRAEMLAHHYGAALQLLQAAGKPTTQMARLARDARFEAGRRARALGAGERAVEHFEGALALTDPSEPEWPRMQLAYGSALHSAREQGEDVLLLAAAALLDASDIEGTAAAERMLAQLQWTKGRAPESNERLKKAMGLLAERPATPEKAEVLLTYWRNLWLAGHHPDNDLLEQALGVAERLERKDLILDARINLALLHGFGGGDPGAIGEHEAAIALAREIGSPDITRAYINLASLHDWRGDKQRSAALHLEGWSGAKRFGDTARARFLKAEIILDQVCDGQWDEALDDALSFIDACARSPHYMESAVQMACTAILLGRDDLARARRHLERLRELAVEVQDPQVAVPTHSIRARFHVETGDLAAAREALTLLPDTGMAPAMLLDPAYVEAAIAANAVGTPERIAPILAAASGETPWTRAIRAILDGRFALAARECASAHERHYASILTLRAIAEREAVEPDQARQAAEFFRSAGATRYLAQMGRGVDPVLTDTG
jgi:AAA ATPase-like protein